MLKAFVWLHRWSGIVLCLLFSLWFASGAVLLFVPFPALDPHEAAARAAPAPLQLLQASPADALREVPHAQALKLIGVLGRPVYVVTAPGGDRAVSGVSGTALPPVDQAAAGRIGAAFGRAAVRSVSGPFDYDQWIVHQAFDHARPLYRVALVDAAHTEIYVSARTGEVVQQTRGAERAWNWVGAVVHWIYVTPIRRSFHLWDRLVWWVSLAGIVVTVLGIVVGVQRTLKKLRSARPALSPFKGWLRWHHILGLGAGAVLLTWIVSGWLSMDHGRLFDRAAPSGNAARRYEGAPLTALAPQLSAARLRLLGAPGGVAFTGVDGVLVAAASGPARSGSWVLTARGGVAPGVDPDAVRAGLHAGWPGASISELRAVAPDDFYAKAEGVDPAEAGACRLGGPVDATVYIDRRSGRVLAFVDKSRAAYDWLYYGLHTFNFPYLLRHPLLRDLIVLVLLACGAALCVTSIMVGLRRLGRGAGATTEARGREGTSGATPPTRDPAAASAST